MTTSRIGLIAVSGVRVDGAFHSRIRRVDVGEVAASDRLVPPSWAREGVALADHVQAEEAHAVRAAWRAR